MQHKKRITISLAVILGTLMILSLIPAPQVAAVYPVPTSPGPKYGGTFIYGLLGDPATLNPGITTDLASCAVGGSLYETLFNYNYQLQPTPNLAKDIVLGADGVTYTVHLVNNATWTDGKPITSADVQFTYDQVLSKYHGKASALWTNGFLTANQSITTPDAYTVVFKLNKPFLGFPSHGALNTIPVLPKQVYFGTDILNNPNNKNPTVTSGPYKLLEWAKGDHVTLVPNDKWFRGKPYLDKIVFKVIPDPEMMVNALENGEINFVPWYVLPPSDYARLKNNAKLVVTDKGADPVWPIVDLGFNLKPGHPITTDHDVREAFMRVIDRQYIVDKIQFGVGMVGTSVMGHNDPYYDATLPAYIKQMYGTTGSADDIAVANKLLDKAYPKKADGTRFTLQLDVLQAQPTQVKAAQVIQEEMKQVGVDIKINVLDTSAFWAAVSNWNYDLHINWWTSVPDPTISVARLYLSRQIRPIVAANAYYYNSSQADTLLNNAASELDLTKRQADWAQFQELVVNDLPKIVLFEISLPQAFTATFQDLCGGTSPPTFTYCHFNVRYVWWSQGTSPVASTSSAVATSTAQAPVDYTGWLAAAVVVILVVAAGTILFSRRRKKAPEKH